MNRVLKRPMFRIGGSAGTGITSGLDQPQKMAKGGRIGYQQGTMPNFQIGGIPGFLTSFGLNLLSTPPRGNIFSTAAIAAQDPFRRLQADQASAMKTASDRAFSRELAKEEREFQTGLSEKEQEFQEGQLEKKLASAEKIANIKTTDTDERIRAIADTKYDGDEIKAAREVNFATKTYPDLVSEYGQESVATSVIDSSGLQKPKDINRFVKQNPTLARQIVYDVRTGKAMRFVKDQTGKFALIPADSVDIDTTGEGQPAPRNNPGLFGQPTKPGKPLKEILPDFRDPDTEFNEDFYQT